MTGDCEVWRKTGGRFLSNRPKHKVYEPTTYLLVRRTGRSGTGWLRYETVFLAVPGANWRKVLDIFLDAAEEDFLARRYPAQREVNDADCLSLDNVASLFEGGGPDDALG